MRTLVLFRKELREQMRTHKLTVMVAVFLAFGLISPLTAKMLPEILKSAGGDLAISLPAPSAEMAIQQYVKNLAQMGLLAVVLVAMGAIATERDRGTAAMVLCKPVSRAAFVGSKFLAYGVVLVFSLALGAAACYYYVAVIFQQLDLAAFAASNGLLAIYLLDIMSLTLLMSALVRSQLAAGGSAILLSLAVSLLGVVPAIGIYSPSALLNWSGALASGVGGASWGALVVGVCLLPLCILVSCMAFRSKEL